MKDYLFYINLSGYKDTAYFWILLRQFISTEKIISITAFAASRSSCTFAAVMEKLKIETKRGTLPANLHNYRQKSVSVKRKSHVLMIYFAAMESTMMATLRLEKYRSHRTHACYDWVLCFNRNRLFSHWSHAPTWHSNGSDLWLSSASLVSSLSE